MNLKVINRGKIKMIIILVKKTTKNSMLDGEVDYNSICLASMYIICMIMRVLRVLQRRS
jgi:hypothetical protein